MLRLSMAIAALPVSIAMLFCAWSTQASEPVSGSVRIAQGQNITIGLIAGGPGSTDTRIAADIAQVVDDSDKLRVLPMLGRGSVQNIADLIYLKGIDVAIVQTDALTQTMQRGSIPKETSLQYITKLFQEEIQVLAGPNIAGLSDLAGKPVAIGSAASGTELTATALLNMLHISPIPVYDAPSVALDRLRRGEIAAMFVIGGKPVPMLQGIEAGSGLHLLAIPMNAQLVDAYLPTSLDHQHYPDLIPSGPPIDTVAISSVLVTLASPSDTLRAKRVNRFVDTLFDRFEQLRHPGFHPKWQEVNLSVQMPGWTRYPEAQSMLKKAQSNESAPRNAFSTYLTQSGQTISGASDGRREELFRDFLRWRDQHSGP